VEPRECGAPKTDLSAGRAALRRLTCRRAGALHLSGRRVLISRRLISARRLRGSLSRRVRLIWSRALARRRRRLVLLRRCVGRLAGVLIRRLACRVLLILLLLACLGLSGLALTRRWGLGTRGR
jgi:hypothetical protein